MKITKQLDSWIGNFGEDYTKRNFMSLDEMEQLWIKNFGFNRTYINNKFLSEISKNARILEVGTNIGNQLLCLQKNGFNNLYGVEPQRYALEHAMKRSKGITFVQGSAFNIPFADSFFDLVFTSGVLIHIAPQDINVVLDEIYRCSKRYIFGSEYYSKEYISIEYREKKDLLWKGDFAKMYLDRFKNLKLVKQEFIKYVYNDNVDIFFLLEKEEE